MCCVIVVVGLLAIILFDIFSKAIGVISIQFLLNIPKRGMTEGGIFSAIVGTTLLAFLTAIFSIPIGVGCAIYLKEYAKESFLTGLIRASIRNLAGVPSIIYGLFGVAIFVQMANMGTSILASGLTLGLMTLPFIISASEEGLSLVPASMREGALALGATKWETIRFTVLPAAVPGILTGAILGLSRAAGETAPILFTGVAFYLRFLPSSVFDEFMALPYHLYILSTQHHDIDGVKGIAYGTALVLIILVFVLNLAAFIIRNRYRSKKFFNP